MKVLFPLPASNVAERRQKSRAGFTLIDVLIASIIMVVALSGAVSTITSTAILGESNRESAVAYQVARGVMEQVQATRFQDVMRQFNADPDDDVDGTGTAPGENFAVQGLDVQAGDTDGFVGEVVLPLSPDGTLREDIVDAALEMPRDLSGNGVVDTADHSDDYVLLPVRVRVAWRGDSGDRLIEYTTTLSLRE